jgi:hypothetical protein
MDETNESKKICITGTNNKYMMKKLIKDNKEEKKNKKRVVTDKWLFSLDSFEEQLKMIIDISNNNMNFIEDKNKVSKTIIQEINKKISSYKQQDIVKNHYDKEKFLTFESVILKMIECKLECRYCKNIMSVLYDISREMKQWSVDRVDNDLGHNINNFHLACLECNLKRRRRTDEKFLFTKQLKIIKQDCKIEEHIIEETNEDKNI